MTVQRKRCCTDRTHDTNDEWEVCHECSSTIVRCVTCGRRALDDLGTCGACLGFRVRAQVGHQCHVGDTLSVPFTVTNESEMTIYVQEGEGPRLISIPARRSVDLASKIEVHKSGDVLLENFRLSVRVGRPDAEVFVYDAVPIPVAKALLASKEPGSIALHVHGNVGAGAEVSAGKVLELGRSAAPSPTRETELRMEPWPGEPADERTPLLDRGLVVQLRGAGSGGEVTRRFSRKAGLVLGREGKGVAPDVPWYVSAQSALSEEAKQEVSRRHAILSVRAGRLWLKDISTNGTWVDGQQLHKTEAVLREGSTLAPWNYQDGPFRDLGCWLVRFLGGHGEPWSAVFVHQRTGGR